jgi:membrane dipeptidase
VCSPDTSQADRLHRDALVWDAHSDVVQSILLQDFDFSQRNQISFQDLPRMEEGGLDVQVFALWPDPIYAPRRSVRRTLQMLDAMLTTIDVNSTKLELARTASDVERIVNSGKMAAILSIEGGHAIEDDLGLLRAYFRLGVTSLTLTHTNSNGWADSSSDDPLWGGLNGFGEEVIREMNRLGMVIDVSHVSDETFFDVLEISRDPVVASHSNCRALSDHERNLSDEMILALGEKGGVMCITFEPSYTSQKFKDARDAARAEARKKAPSTAIRPEDVDEWAKQRELEPRILPDMPFPSLAEVLDQIDYAVKLIGAEHVAIGHDYSVMFSGPVGIEDVSQFPNLTKGLLERGYSESDIRFILGENLLRIWREVTEK